MKSGSTGLRLVNARSTACAQSYSKRMIANELHITFHQVEEHLEAMRAKLGDDPYLPRNPPA
jgi:hypothetical protein